VGVNAVETSETDSFLIMNCAGLEGPESDFVPLPGKVADLDSLVGGVGKSGIADRGAAGAVSGRGTVVILLTSEFLRRGISSSFQSWEVLLGVRLFFRRDRSDILRVMASVASFAIVEIEDLRSRLTGGTVSCRGGEGEADLGGSLQRTF